MRIYGLDILRASAILLVVGYHCKKPLEQHVAGKYFYALPDGVTLFFVLSGFLIGGILIRSFEAGITSSGLLRFWRHRWLRTLPAYYCILFLLILHRIYANSAEGPGQYLRYIFFVQNIDDGNLYFFGESWSLSVEEWFYLLTPLFIWLSVRLTKMEIKTTFLFWICFILLASLLLREMRIANLSFPSYDHWSNAIRKPIIMRMDSIMIGVAGAWVFHYYPLVWKKYTRLYVAGLLMIGLCTLSYIVYGFNRVTIHARLLLESFGTLLLLPFLSQLKTGRGYVFRILTFISLISYSMYLVNFSPFNEWVLPRLPKIGIVLDGNSLSDSLLLILIFLVWTFSAALLLHRLVERPFMHMRKRTREIRGNNN